ncbi:MAG TPA: trypsin-like peptidase domain-containing protein [Ktedonobacteraceae bacterium]|nr:trypsin-like peptidase domain-containing protein [Ktedonobacteraceae bacterium]
MASSLYELLSDCTVRVTSKGSQGTGFFVAPGLILTCSHVLADAYKANTTIEVSWKEQLCSASIYAYRDALYPDIALLSVTIPGHPCVLLHGSAQPFSDLYSYGFADNEPQGAPTTFACEGSIGQANELLKFKEGQVRPGMSGSPVLNRETGCVCGIVQITRDRSSALGGKALLSQVILREFPELAEKQQQFHRQDSRWYDAMSPAQRKQAGINEPAEQGKSDNTIEVFYSYAAEDEKMALRLQKHLILLKRQNLITDWYAAKIIPGEEPSEQIKKHLDSARIILLLISPDYMFSEHHDTVEVKRAMERSKSGEAVIIPVLLRSFADWTAAPFGKLLAIPRNGKPINRWADKDEAFAEVAKEIRAVVHNLRP